MVSIGEKVDLDFLVKGMVDGARWEGAFKDLVKGPTVVSVYMRNNTSSCDKQTKQLREVAGRLAESGIGLVAVSRDTIGSHERYAAKHDLPYTLVSDPDFQFARAVDSLVEKKLYGRPYTGPSRSAYLIDSNGTVCGIIDKVDSAKHAAQLVSLLEESG